MSDGLSVREEAWSGGDTRLARTVARPLVRFLAQEAASGVLLLVATAGALIWVNGPFGDSYQRFWSTEIGVTVNNTLLFAHNGHPLTLDLWVNDALMVLFFFVVGLEIKSEMVVGDLRDPKVASLPAIAALGGMIVPALIYAGINFGGDGIHGWGVPMATDIAFAVGVLALLGPIVPHRLKLFLLTLAIADDIGAIVVIAVFYSGGLSWGWLALAFGGLALVYLLRTYKIWYVPVYVVVGVFVWYAMFRSGVHSTIAGVALGLLTPATPLLGRRRFESVEDVISGERVDPVSMRDAGWKLRESVAMTTRLIAELSPYTSFVIVPIFALANAGVQLSGSAIGDAVTSPVALGVFFGLVIGKPVGITLFTFAAVKARISSLPRGVHMGHIVGVGMVAGVGFTVALFVAHLAFDHPGYAQEATMGILAASVAASLLGWVVLRAVAGREAAKANPAESEAALT